MSDLSSKTIIIIGAGVSGLTAARHLFDRGYKNVKIFEATDRIGGRICTKNIRDGWVEIGAQWIHGEKDNVAYETAVRHQLLSEARMEGIETSLFYSEDGAEVNDKLAENIYEFLENSLNRSHLAITNRQTGVITIDDYLNNKFDQMVSKKNFTSNEKTILPGLLKWFKAIQCSIEGCDSLAELSTVSFTKYKECEGNSLTNFKSGYRTLIETIACGLPKEKIHFNKAVVNLDLQSIASGVKIICSDSTVYKADHVILTVSLGFLKQNASTLFNPPLPHDKRQVIEKLGFGTVNKVFLEFDHPFWSPSSGGYNLVWKNEEQIKSDPIHHWGRDFLGFVTVPFASNVLCGWLTGANARYMETLSDDQVLQTCIYILQKFSGITNLPAVKSITRSKWHSNPFTKGSYTYFTNNQYENEELAKPITKSINNIEVPVILFAGEATHPHYYSTVHGAMETGYREANRIVNYYSINTTKTRSNL